jgi:hypothetical protein
VPPPAVIVVIPIFNEHAIPLELALRYALRSTPES